MSNILEKTNFTSEIDERLEKEALDGDRLWKLDPYQGRLQKEKLSIKTQDQIEMKIAQSLVNIREDDPDLAKLPNFGLVNSLKKEMDKKYKLDTLKQLEAIDTLISKGK